MHKLNDVRNQQFWCSICDAHQVDSDKPETGQFFGQFGHQWQPDFADGGSVGDYHMVVLAVCGECLENHSITAQTDTDDETYRVLSPKK